MVQVQECTLTRRTERGLDEGFRPRGDRLHRPCLFGCQLLQTDPPLVEHVLHGRLLLQHLVHLVLMHKTEERVCVCLGWPCLLFVLFIHVCFPLAVLTLNCWLSTASYSVVMVLRSVSWFWLALSR